MNSIESILGMIATEAQEGVESRSVDEPSVVICYDLELIELEDGTCEWVE